MKYGRYLAYIQKFGVRDKSGTQLLKWFVLEQVGSVIPTAATEFSFTFLLNFGAIQFVGKVYHVLKKPELTLKRAHKFK